MKSAFGLGEIKMERVRRFKPEDTEELIGIYIDTYAQEPWKEDWHPESVRQRISDLTINPISICYVICDENGLIVGGLFGRRNIFLEAKELFIDEFFISSNHQRNGYGSRLMNFAGIELKKEGYSCLVLNTERRYPSEIFYKNNGFRIKESNIFMYKNI
ncbi:N-acetyltransferase [Desulfosporosinus fructosivorans]|uniref:N-acetyltransferase n=2 Tax=Desulfosporosinus fructosivorans TaxID=2018669 RepID=A0A4Z0QZF8_9FIRM|nr:N-acetyltransferase [Desulfosporosinus fructosivorans]